MLLWLALIFSLGLPQAEDLFARVRRLNPTLADSTASVNLELDATLGIIHERRQLKGTYYYKREGKHKLDLPDAPSYLKERASVLAFSLPRLERYTVKSLRQEPRGWHLELVPRTPQGSIQRLEMWIHPQDRTVLEYDTYYSNGQLLVSLTYTKAGNYRVADSMTARFDFPDLALKATARARYSDFRFNQGLSDGLF
jgi:outer membrane lipoprotein-sorting protein